MKYDLLVTSTVTENGFHGCSGAINHLLIYLLPNLFTSLLMYFLKKAVCSISKPEVVRGD